MTQETFRKALRWVALGWLVAGLGLGILGFHDAQTRAALEDYADTWGVRITDRRD